MSEETGGEGGQMTSSPLNKNKNKSKNPEGERIEQERSEVNCRSLFMVNHDPDYGRDIVLAKGAEGHCSGGRAWRKQGGGGLALNIFFRDSYFSFLVFH